MNPERLSRQPEVLIPMVIETTNRCERAFDIYSRLLKDRIICNWAMTTLATWSSMGVPMKMMRSLSSRE